jgi:predicted DNA-binding transcriptional regulator YafY
VTSIVFTYQNHKGVRSERRVKPIGVMFVSNPGFGYQPGWFLHGFCMTKMEVRSFSLSHIILPEGVKNFLLEWPATEEGQPK